MINLTMFGKIIYKKILIFRIRAKKNQESILITPNKMNAFAVKSDETKNCFIDLSPFNTKL